MWFYIYLITTYNTAMKNKKEYIDLHIHSTSSDGAFSAYQLVHRAARLCVSTIAIADHDSLASIEEAMLEGSKLGVEVIPAVELSVQFKEWQDIHLLGYGIDYKNQQLKSRLDYFSIQRQRRNELILELVNKKLISEGKEEMSIGEVTAFVTDVMGRPHIARALIERRYAGSVEDAFRRYLKPCNVAKEYWQMHEAINEIKRCGGVAVLAHPTSISTNMDELFAFIGALLPLGLDGIEVYNNMAQLEEQEYLRRFAADHNLLMTAGSDFHGIEEGIEIGTGRAGIRFDSSLLAPLKKRLHLIKYQVLSL